MTPRVTAEGVWKKFRRGERHDSLRDALAAKFRRRSVDQLDARDFWSVRDVSFVVEPGQSLGIIGGNGAGKSTTLKLLTKILRPTKGTIVTNGRVGALIEVAAGFHPDLTGRENVFLQGAIMGMRQGDILRRFDEIVAFSGVEEFLDTQVKRFSSGMNARLGFAIAAHLDPDILVIDEVLAVGDMAFQKRAFERLKALVVAGIPVIVVSHQLDKIRELCSSAMLLEHGGVAAFGEVDAVIGEYLKPSATTEPSRLAVLSMRFDPGASSLECGGLLQLELVLRPADDWDAEYEILGIRLLDVTGRPIGGTGSDRLGFRLRGGETSSVTLSLRMNVGEGLYRLEIFVWHGQRTEYVEQAASATLSVSAGDGVGYGDVYLAFQATLDGIVQ